MKRHVIIPTCKPFSIVLAIITGLLVGLGGLAIYELPDGDSHHLGVVVQSVTTPGGSMMMVADPFNGWKPVLVATSIASTQAAVKGDWVLCAGKKLMIRDSQITSISNLRVIPLSMILPADWCELIDKETPKDKPTLMLLIGFFGLLPILHRKLFRIVFAIVLAVAGALASWHLATLLELVNWIDWSNSNMYMIVCVGSVLGYCIALGSPCVVRVLMQRFLAVAILILVQASLANILFGGGHNLVRVLLIMVCFISPAAALAAVSAFLLHLGTADHSMSIFAFLFITLVIVIAVDKHGPSLVLPRLNFWKHAKNNES